MAHLDLALGPKSSWVDRVEIGDRELALCCTYDPTGEGKAYKVAFGGVSGLERDALDDDDADGADLIGLDAGDAGIPGSAVVHTSAYELRFRYESYSLTS